VTGGQIEFVVRYIVKAGEEDRYQRYLDVVMPVMEKREPFVLAYDIFRADDGSYLQHELYENEEAINRHVKAIAATLDDFTQSTEILDVRVLGPVSEQFWQAFAGPMTHAYSLHRNLKR
jgi:quinol monooxygenase YgiN